MLRGATRHGPACFQCYYALWKGYFVLETLPCSPGAQPPGNMTGCNEGDRRHDASCRDAWCQAVRGCHGFSAGLLKLWEATRW